MFEQARGRLVLLFVYLKSRKYFVVALFLLVALTTGIVIKISSSEYGAPDASDLQKKSGQIALKSITITLSSSEGTVQISEKNDDNWTDVVVGQNLALGSAIKTTRSKALLSIDQESWLAVDEYSMIVINTATEKEIKLEQVYGKTYHMVKAKTGQTYSVIKDQFVISSLGTEFMVIIPDNYQTIEVRVYKSKVSYSQGAKKGEIAESSKLLFAAKDTTYISSTMNEEEKGQNSGYIALIDKAKKTTQEIQAADVEATKKSASSTGNSSPTGSEDDLSVVSSDDSSSNSSTSPSTNGSSGNSSSSGGSGVTATIPETQPDNEPAPTIFGGFSADSVESIVNSLQLVYDDATGDYVTPPGGADPVHGVYEYSPIDFDKIYMGVSGGRLYIKWELAGTNPTSQPTVSGNQVESNVYNMHISNMENPSGDACDGVNAHIQSSIAYHDDGQIWYGAWYNANCNNTGPYPSQDAWGFANHGDGTVHTYNSGAGKTSVVYSIPLSGLNFNVGDTIYIHFWSEAESNLWDHFSFDNAVNQWGWTDWASWTVADI